MSTEGPEQEDEATRRRFDLPGPEQIDVDTPVELFLRLFLRPLCIMAVCFSFSANRALLTSATHIGMVLGPTWGSDDDGADDWGMLE